MLNWKLELCTPRLWHAVLVVTWMCGVGGWAPKLLAQNRYATSDSLSGYVHWIDLYDASNTRIDPQAEFPKPYSPERTCGRCHDFDTISHGWHFDAVDRQVAAGRPGQPWIWSDPRTGTHLPLSYRGWEGTYDPDILGLSRWQVAAKLGGFMPGGGVGSADSLAQPVAAAAGTAEAENRTQITGSLPVDCMLCHNQQGSGYSPFEWTHQIESQNFAYAPTVAAGLAEVTGNMARLKELEPAAADAASKLPKVDYDLGRFRSDGKVFFDLVRKPQNNACYYCHTNAQADSIGGSRWSHDEDVHLRAGLSCADCHRNSLDHQTVRGFEGESHPAGSLVASFSCQGCHVGQPDHSLSTAGSGPGRLGAPLPAHRGLPPVHFEKLSCTACHSGPEPQQSVGRQVNSIAHHLGEHVKRTGQELPGIVGPVNLPVTYGSSSAPVESSEAQSQNAQEPAAAKYTPHRLMWPSFWGTLEKGRVLPLNPEVAYELVRKPLKVRKEFTQELAEVSLSLSQRKELLGDARARVKDDERTAEEKKKITEAEAIARRLQMDERMLGALTAIEEKVAGQAVFVTGGVGFVRDGNTKIKELASQELGAAANPYAWPLAHNVRPARLALGVKGCTECHSDTATFFHADIAPTAVLPEQYVAPVKVHVLQNADMPRLQNWNKMFAGRSTFKIASLAAFAVACLVTLIAFARSAGSAWRGRT